MLISKEGQRIDPENLLKEYPRPQMERSSYLNLNGYWDFRIDKSKTLPDLYDSRILVPFAVETDLSEITKRVEADDVMHYRKVFEIPEGFNKGRILLHFMAVDQTCEVYFNGKHIGGHKGGYVPFTFELPDPKVGENVIQVEVQDDVDSPIYARGKQSKNPVGVWYEPTSGIWQTVWIESVPDIYVKSLKLLPDFDSKSVVVHVETNDFYSYGSVICSDKSGNEMEASIDSKGDAYFDLKDAFHPWSVEDPFLYDLKIKINQDEVRSYFGLRKIGQVEHKGHKVIGLNGKPIFLSGVLDQGYWSGSGMTAPTDQALIDDIMMIKSMGFNTMRKHIKIESLRWYYHCDRLGVIVNQDILNGGDQYLRRYIWVRPFVAFNKNDQVNTTIKKLGRGNPDSRSQFVREMGDEVELLFNSPCIGIWTLFNEGWGQFNTKTNLLLLRNMDPTRLIDANSGWFDQGVGDFDSKHFYFQNVAKRRSDPSRILALSECGGFSLKIEGHLWLGMGFGYRSCKDRAAFLKRMKKLCLKRIKVAIKTKGLSEYIYTQLSDVEGEMNGLITYDREELKIDPEEMKKINDCLKFEDE